MRLKREEIEVLKNAVAKRDKKAAIYLFGSRTKDEKRGGDIDILIRSDTMERKDLRKIRLEFFDRFGEQKLDLLLDRGEENSPFLSIVHKEAVPL